MYWYWDMSSLTAGNEILDWSVWDYEDEKWSWISKLGSRRVPGEQYRFGFRMIKSD